MTPERAEELFPRGTEIAKAFHEAYERLAPDHGYHTREESAKVWQEVPLQNRALMTHVVVDLLDRGVIS